jgi:hypothetical protein
MVTDTTEEFRTAKAKKAKKDIYMVTHKQEKLAQKVLGFKVVKFSP